MDYGLGMHLGMDYGRHWLVREWLWERTEEGNEGNRESSAWPWEKAWEIDLLHFGRLRELVVLPGREF